MIHLEALLPSDLRLIIISMSIRKHDFIEGEYYHLYNRGVDKRDIISDHQDLDRLFRSIIEFNQEETIGSIYENSFKKDSLGSKASKLVTIVAYCINPTHFHLLVTPLVDNGIEKFMQRMGGYTKYFNERNDRNGSLFQGKFKSKHVDDNNYLLRLSAYVNMNNRDLLGSKASKLSKSSLEEYVDDDMEDGICDSSIVLDQFKNKKEYFEFAKEAWADSLERKKYLEM